MDLKRLFQVLVVGGQMVGCSAARPAKVVPGESSDGASDGANDGASEAASEENNDARPGQVDGMDEAVGVDLAADVELPTVDAAIDAAGAADAPTEASAVDAMAADLTPDSSPADAIGTSDAAKTDGGRLSPCFCNTTPSCCQAHPDGTKGAVEGVECCWGTSC